MGKPIRKRWKARFSPGAEAQMRAGFCCQVGSAGLSLDARNLLDEVGRLYANGYIKFAAAVKLRDAVRSGNLAYVRERLTWATSVLAKVA